MNRCCYCNSKNLTFKEHWLKKEAKKDVYCNNCGYICTITLIGIVN